MPSVIEAAMNRAEAKSSFSPLVLGKRLVERIHINSGILKMRLSVMELGRFTGMHTAMLKGETSDGRLSPTVQGESNGRERCCTPAAVANRQTSLLCCRHAILVCSRP